MPIHSVIFTWGTRSDIGVACGTADVGLPGVGSPSFPIFQHTKISINVGMFWE